MEKDRELSLEESEERAKARDDYKRWSLIEEASWRQNSRELWLKEGDRNTGFFHKMANSHRRRNAINKVRINGSWLTEDIAIQNGIVDEFKGQLSEPGGWRPAFPNISLEELGTENAGSLEVRFLRRKFLQPLQVSMVRRPQGRMVSRSLSGLLAGSLLKTK